MSHVRTTVRPVVTLKQAAACLLVLALALPAACAGRKPPKQAQGPAFTVSSEHVQLLRRHRPDLAERWTTPSPEEVAFVPLDINNVAGHEQSLRALLDRARALPASADADSLRARLTFELGQTVPGGALRTDPLLWLAIVEAAARAPFAYDSTAGCREVERAMRQFELIPEALRGAAVLMRGAPPPDPIAFEAGLTRVEWVFRHDLPRRTKACKEGRLLAEFVEADTLAAASLAGFRRLLVSGP
jgi:hypothetical protein